MGNLSDDINDKNQKVSVALEVLRLNNDTKTVEAARDVLITYLKS